MHKFIVMGIGAIIQIAMTVYFISILGSVSENKKHSKRQIIISLILISLGIFISTFGKISNTILKVLICSLPTLFALTFVLKVKFIKSVLITIGAFISFAVTELISMIIFASVFKCNVDNIVNNLAYFATFTFLQNLLLLILIRLSIFLISKFTKFNDMSESITSNQIFSLILLIGICLLPKILIRGLN